MYHRIKEQLRYAREGGHTQRFHTQRTLMVDTVGHHSFNVAWLCHFLSTHLSSSLRYTLMLAALEHDLAEHKLGDIPAPAKRDENGDKTEVGDALEDQEAALNASMGFGYADALDDEARRILKLADAMDGALFCCHERALGNRTIANCYDNFLVYIEKVVNRERWQECAILSLVTETWEKVNYGQSI